MVKYSIAKFPSEFIEKPLDADFTIADKSHDSEEVRNEGSLH